MLIRGALFAEKIEFDGDRVGVTSGSPSYYVNPDASGDTVVVSVLLFVDPQPGEEGERVQLQAQIVDTDGDVVGSGPMVAAPDYRVGGSLGHAEIHTQFEKPWHYFLYVDGVRITGFDVLFAE